MIPFRSGTAMMVFLTVTSFALAGSVTNPWTVRDGWISLELDGSLLSEHGVRIVAHDGAAQSSDDELLFLSLKEGASAELSLSDRSGRSSPQGRVALDGQLVLEGPDGAVRVDHPIFDVVSDAPLAIAGEVDGHFARLLEMSAARRAYDKAAGAFLFESLDVVLTQATAERIGAPALVGLTVGTVRGRLDGDAEVGELGQAERAEADGVPSVVAGGNNGTVCPAPVGPDLIVGDLFDVMNYPAVGSIEAFTMGTYSCNVGNQNAIWISGNNQHPVISQNMFRLKNGRFEHIGQAWLKHGFTALTDNICGCGCSGQGGSVLGVGCADPYWAGLNGQQGGMGPKWQVNANTGAFTYPYQAQGQGGNDIYKRVQVAVADLEVAGAGSTTHYYIEGHYVSPDDCSWGNQDNSASYRRAFMSGGGSAWNINLTGAPGTVREKPGIRAWKAADPSVQETEIRVPGEGLFILAAKTTDLGGFWQYEYALQNLNSDRSGRSFSIPVGSGVVVQNIGFHDVSYHSGEPFDGTDWTATVANGAITWSTDSQATNPNANALRWATLYNFRFEANAAPGTVVATLGLFKQGSPSSVTADVAGPALAPECSVDADCDDGLFCNGGEICVTANGQCRGGVDPCVLQSCDEASDSCVDAPGCGPCRLYTDIVNSQSSEPGADCLVDLSEITRFLDSFGDSNPCLNFPETEVAYQGGCPQACAISADCSLGGVCSAIGECCVAVELADMLIVLDTFAGDFLCPHPCPPGACNFDTNADTAVDCCKDDSFYLGGMSESDCFDQGGIYAGDNTSCTLPACPP